MRAKMDRWKKNFSQDGDSCSGEDTQFLIVEQDDGGGGPFWIIETERWAFDSLDEPDKEAANSGAQSSKAVANAEENGANEADKEPAELLADPEGFLAKLADDISICDSVEELAQLVESNTGIIARLPKAHKKRAEAMLKEAAE